jgi:flagellar motor protein MotB
LIEGHADRQPIGQTSSFEDNWQLSTARAQTFYRVLIEIDSGLANAKNKDRQSVFGIVGFGDSRPSAAPRLVGQTNVREDRRIEIRLVFAPPTLPSNLQIPPGGNATSSRSATAP